jgi:DNA-binding transcriptional MerR regulator
MKEKRYFISDAAKELEVESHVLRYWEEELNLDIPRNEMGHRYYREEEIQMFTCIKELKARGFQLKTIKQILTELQEGKGEATRKLEEIKEEERREQMGRSQGNEMADKSGTDKKKEERRTEESVEEAAAAREVLDNVVPIHTQSFQEVRTDHEQRLQEFEEIMGRIVGQAMRENSHFLGVEVSEQVSGTVVKEMDYLFRLQEEREEKRFQNLDHTIRQYQKVKRETATPRMQTKSKGRKKKRSMFFQKRGRRTI